MGSELLMKDYVLGKANNVYKVFIERVLRCLIDKGLLHQVKHKYGNEEIVAYEGTDRV